MNIRPACLGLTVINLMMFAAGCTKPEPSSPPPPSILSPDTIIRAHWMGKRQLGTNAGAYYFMRIWNLPESTRLEAQTVEKLSTVPWRHSGNPPEANNASALLLRALLYDVVQEECFLEVRQSSNQTQELAFAIRLDSSHAGNWETNLAIVVQSLTATQPAALPDQRRGWIFKPAAGPQRIELNRIGPWIVAGIGPQPSTLFDEVTDRIQRYGTPFSDQGSNYWLQADLDLQRLATTCPVLTNLSSDLPRVSLAVNGDGGNVITRGELVFPRSLPIQFDPWEFPTHRIVEPIVSFTALRGFAPWLASLKIWNDLQIGAPPNQICLWAPDGAPQQVIFTAPAADASNQVRALTGMLTQSGNAWLATNGVGKLDAIPEANGVIWTGLPLITPFIRTVDEGRTILGALRTDVASGTNFQSAFFYHPSLAELLADTAARSNLVWYDWELTAPRVEATLPLGQVLRIGLGRPQLPVGSASLDWLRMIHIRLGNCTTLMSSTAPNQLSFYRKSTVGLAGAELQLFADWLESPQFPVGLHSLLSSPGRL